MRKPALCLQRSRGARRVTASARHQGLFDSVCDRYLSSIVASQLRNGLGQRQKCVYSLDLFSLLFEGRCESFDLFLLLGCGCLKIFLQLCDGCLLGFNILVFFKEVVEQCHLDVEETQGGGFPLWIGFALPSF